MRWPLLLAMAVIAAGPGSAQMAEPPPGQQIWSPSTGLICIWAIEASLLEVGRRCDGPRNLAFEAELAESVTRIEDYARRQSPQTAAFMADYRARLIEQDAEACNVDALGMYRAMSSISPDRLRGEMEELLASSPPVEWGTCL